MHDDFDPPATEPSACEGVSEFMNEDREEAGGDEHQDVGEGLPIINVHQPSRKKGQDEPVPWLDGDGKSEEAKSKHGRKLDRSECEGNPYTGGQEAGAHPRPGSP
jgi:hypothetical protein